MSARPGWPHVALSLGPRWAGARSGAERPWSHPPHLCASREWLTARPPSQQVGSMGPDCFGHGQCPVLVGLRLRLWGLCCGLRVGQILERLPFGAESGAAQGPEWRRRGLTCHCWMYFFFFLTAIISHFEEGVCLCVCVCTHVYVCRCVCTRVLMHTCTRTRARACLCLCVPARVCTRV